MKIRFRVPEAGDPRREGGVSLPPQESKRVPPRLRWAIITVLALSPAIWVLWHFAYGWLWIESRGYVVFEEISINAPLDASVARLAVVNGSVVDKGAELLRLDNPELRAELASLHIADEGAPVAAPSAAESGQLNQQLATQRSQYQSLQQRSAILRDLAAQGAATRGEVLAAENEELAAAAGLQRTRSDMLRLARSTQSQTVEPSRDQRARIAMLETRLQELEIRAPVGGTVDDLVVNSGQHISRGEPMLVLRHGQPHIVAFMAGKDLGLAQSGEMLSIVLPDKQRIAGRVLGPAPSTRRLPEELAGSLDPRNPRLQVLIEPQALPATARIHRLPVTIRSFRFRW